MKRLTAIAALMLASACVSVVTPPPATGPCNAARAQGLVGRAANSQVGTEARRLTGARDVRWIGPNTAVTMDYLPDRLNIETDAQNRVRAIRCG